MAQFTLRHLIGIGGLTPGEITAILDEAEGWIAFNRQNRRTDDRLRGLSVVTAFFENSTRTSLSFELAGKRLGADVVNFRPAQSSVRKGETLIDTALTIDAMRPDVIIIRHETTGAAAAVAERVQAAVINAGDGIGEHPTQALTDALTIRRRKGGIAGLKVAICGDIVHSRVAHSNLALLTALGAEVRLVGPSTLLPHPDEYLNLSTSFDEGIRGADVVMMLRIQRERMEEALLGALHDYHGQYGLTHDRLAAAAPDAIVMHPGPMNRGVEIDSAVADDPQRSVILEQVENGVAVRMACLDLLTRARQE